MVESRRAPTMMGQQSREESLFYSFRVEDQIPETHLLRLIDRYVDFTFVRDRLPSVSRLETVLTRSPSQSGEYITAPPHPRRARPGFDRGRDSLGAGARCCS